MGKVLKFPVSKEGERRLQILTEVRIKTPRKKKIILTLKDLGGRKPKGHPKLKRGPRGKVLLAQGQVWVEGYTDKLYVIKNLHEYKPGVYAVIIMSYNDDLYTCKLISEHTLRRTMDVWDEARKIRREIVKKFRKIMAAEGKDPTKVFNFFGLDKNGYRLHD